MNLVTPNQDDVKESEMHTALHEIVHLLGGISPGPTIGTSNFIDSTGAKADPSKVFLVESDPAYTTTRTGVTKDRTLITTPSVVKFTQQYYACPSAKGFPLEDLPLGAGVHWEARVAGPELMSYGSNSGQIFISDLTLGFLADTGYYIVDYSKGGAIVTPSTDNSMSIGSPTQMIPTSGSSSMPVPTPLPAGAQRWGLNAGCDFLNGDPRTSMPAPYTCAKAQEYLCTADNRMSAVCVIQTKITVDTDPFSQGGYVQQPATNGPDPTGGKGGPYPLTTPKAAQPLPAWAQFFASDAAAVAASGVASATAAGTGGFNNAMDYLPVPVGYWSCAYQAASSNQSVSGSGISLSSFTSAIGSSATDMTTFGGQSRCPSCRCMQSSLMALSSLSVNTAFPSYGLCYRTNCATYNYLQVGIKGQFDGKTYWYPCPTAGGKFYVPGFSGALTCPVASTFCQLEPITGLMYPEQNALYELVFWGVILGTLLVCFLVCACKCLRDRCINCSKRLCGARVFEPPGGHTAAGDDDADGVAPPPSSARVLCATSSVTLLAGLGIVGYMGYIVKTAQLYGPAINVLGLGSVITLLSFAGVKSARARSVHGPSCWLLTYFFINMCVSTLIAYSISQMLAVSSWSSYVSTYYDVLVASGYVSIPGNTTYAAGVAIATTKLQNDMSYLLALAGCVLLAFLVALVVAARVMTARVLVSILLTFTNNIVLFIGLIFVAVGAYIGVTNAASLGGMTQVLGYIIALGVVLVVVSAVGHFGVARKSFMLVVSFMILTLGLLAACAAGCWLCFNRADLIVSWVNAQDDAVLAKISQSLNLALSKSSLIANLQSNLRMLGICFGVVVLLQIVTFVTSGAFLLAVKSWRIEHGVRAASRARRSYNNADSPLPLPFPADFGQELGRCRHPQQALVRHSRGALCRI